MRRAGEPNLVAGVPGEEHLVAGLDQGHVGPDGRDDPRAHVHGLVRGHDQAARELGFVERLQDDVVVERLERDVVGDWAPFQHASTILVSMEVSNPDKMFFPERGLTKLDLVTYYADV